MHDSGYRRHRASLDESWFDEESRPGKVLENMVQVKCARTRKIAMFRHDDWVLAPGDQVVVETERGTAEGVVLSRPAKAWVSPRGLRSIVRFVKEPGDPWQAAKHDERERSAKSLCSSLVAQFRLDMKLVDVEYVPWENRTVFYFVADGRIDFRELVKGLSRNLRCRIEMRQIGPRDETKMLGGMGRCGREHCCSSHLREFKSVRTKMAKEQGLVVNQEKITGHCRKLLCCLAYEREVYSTLRQDLPAIGTRIFTADGVARVVELHIIRQSVKVLMEESRAVKELPAARLRPREAGDGDHDEGITMMLVEAAPRAPQRSELEDDINEAARDAKKGKGKGRSRRRRPRGDRPGDERTKESSATESAGRRRGRRGGKPAGDGRGNAPGRGRQDGKPRGQGGDGPKPTGEGQGPKEGGEGGRRRRRRRRK